MLKLNGQPLVIDTLSAWQRELLKQLDALPHDEVFTARELAPRFGIKENSMRDVGGKPTFASYTFMKRGEFGGYRIWGHPSAIKALQIEIAKVRG